MKLVLQVLDSTGAANWIQLLPEKGLQLWRRNFVGNELSKQEGPWEEDFIFSSSPAAAL